MKATAKSRISGVKLRIDDLNAISRKLDESRKSIETIGVSLRLLESPHPLPILRSVNPSLRAQALLGKRKQKQIYKNYQSQKRLFEEPAEFQY
jgi:hypothetical protein